MSYDLVLEDRILAHQGTKRRTRPFGREVAEMVRYAVGYQSRAFVTFGEPIGLKGYDPDLRRDVMALAHLTRDTIGRLYKVLPTAVVSAALRPGMTRRELEQRAQAVIDDAAAAGANLEVTSGREAVERAAEPLEARGIVHVERGGRFRVRERTVLRYYARTLTHLLGIGTPHTSHALIAGGTRVVCPRSWAGPRRMGVATGPRASHRAPPEESASQTRGKIHHHGRELPIRLTRGTPLDISTGVTGTNQKSLASKPTGQRRERQGFEPWSRTIRNN